MKIHKHEIKKLSVWEILFLSTRCEEAIPKEWLNVKSKDELMEALQEISDKGIISGYLDRSASNIPSNITDRVDEKYL